MHKLSTLPLRITLAVTLSVLACGDPTGPPRELFIRAGETVSGHVNAVDRPVNYVLSVKRDEAFVVFFQSFNRGLTLAVIDPRTNEELAGAQDLDTTGALTDVRTAAIRPEADGRLYVRVAAQADRDVGDFRVLVKTVPQQPEGRSAHLALNDTILESLDPEYDIDEYTFEAAPNDEIIIFAKPGPPGWLVIHLVAPDGTSLLDLDTFSPNTELESISSGRIVLPAAGQYRVVVDQRGRAAPLPYTLQVRRVDHAPEQTSTTMTSGDTVDAERIDYVGDIDEFLIAGQPGDLYNVFVQSLGPAINDVIAEVLDQPNTRVGVQLGEALMQGGTGAFALPASGRATIRVSGAFDRFGLYRGPYRILAYRIDLGTEHAEGRLAPPFTVEERIELPGDIDRFSLTMPNAGIVNLVVGKPTGDAGAFRLRLRRSGEQTEIASAIAFYASAATDSRGSTGNVLLAAGDYVVEVDGFGGRKGGYFGGYEVTPYRIELAPEHRAVATAIGDTVAGESIDHIGDVDEFTFSGTAGQSVYAFFEPHSTLFSRVGAEIVHPRLGPLIQLPSHVVGPIPSMRVELPETGTYTLRVSSYDTKDDRQIGAYRAGVMIASRAPESALAMISVTDRVTKERIDYAGDIDEFALTGAHGQEMTATYVGEGELNAFSQLTVVDPATGSVVATAGYLLQGGWLHTGRFQIPASGRAILRVMQPPLCLAPGLCYHVTGSFDLTTRLVDRMPENVSARIAVGDTVVGEAVAFPGDIDEFLFAGSDGQRVRVLLRAGAPIYFPGTLLVEVVDPTTGAVLASATAAGSDRATDVVALPAARDFMVRVRGLNDKQDGASFSLVLESP